MAVRRAVEGADLGGRGAAAGPGRLGEQPRGRGLVLASAAAELVGPELLDAVDDRDGAAILLGVGVLAGLAFPLDLGVVALDLVDAGKPLSGDAPPNGLTPSSNAMSRPMTPSPPPMVARPPGRRLPLVSSTWEVSSWLFSSKRMGSSVSGRGGPRARGLC